MEKIRLFRTLGPLIVVACLVGGCFFEEREHHRGGWHHGYGRHEIGYLMFFDGNPANTQQERLLGGVFVSYVLGEPNEPTFTWSNKNGRFYVNDQQVSWEDAFVLYVNDARGNAKKIILTPAAAQSMCSKIDQADEAALDALQRQHVQPQLQPQGGV